MRKPLSVDALEDLGRVRLSRSFFMRDFLYSEIANFYGVPNTPDDPDLAVDVGKALCEQLLEPLQATFGRVAVRSAYRSSAVNQLGNERNHNCGSNESNFAAHIWDKRDAQGNKGAMACVVLPWFIDRYECGADWRSLAFWIHDHLPYSQLQFFPKLCAFNIGWRENPAKTIYSFIEPRGLLLREGLPLKGQHAALYADFPRLQGVMLNRSLEPNCIGLALGTLTVVIQYPCSGPSVIPALAAQLRHWVAPSAIAYYPYPLCTRLS